MKNKKLLTFYLCFFIFFPVILFAAERYSVSSAKLNVRSGPGTDYEVLWQAEKYYPFNIINKKGKWGLFEDFEGYKGWVYMPLLGKEHCVVVNVGRCNVRKGPSTNYPVIFTAEKGTPFIVKSVKGDWYNVQHSDGDVGWIKKNLLW